ncbi:MAG: NifU family protein [Pseudomonadota bacterium]|nr:NifU family protein [Pseudomonadota bacterium]
MSAGNREDPQQALHRLEELIRALDGHTDPAAKETARELLTLVLDLHGIGLAKLMGIVTTAEGGTAILARLVENEQVQAMLLLHGLHPDDLETRVRRAVDRLRPHLGVHGLRLDVVEIARGTVRLRLHGSGAATIKAPLLWTLPGEIEDAVVEAAPDVEKILIDGLVPQEAAAAVRAAE